MMVTRKVAGSGARIRTWEWQIQSLLPYRLATPECCTRTCTSAVTDSSAATLVWYMITGALSTFVQLLITHKAKKNRVGKMVVAQISRIW